MEKFYGYLNKIRPALISIIFTSLVFTSVYFLNSNKYGSITLSVEIVGFFGIIYMIASWFLYEKEVSYKKRVGELEKEIEELRNDSLTEKSEIQDYFLMWVHQIKTPITVSNLVVETIEDFEYKNKLLEELLEIEEYTNMAMSYIKISNKNTDMDIAEVKVDEVVRPILKKYSMLFINKKLKLDYKKIEEKIVTDARWFSILLEQIISNSIKYTEAGRISISFDEEKNALEVKDTGIGIKNEDVPKIFDRGYSGFNGRINQKSSGIGLFMAGKISKNLNVKIEVESSLGEGSTFRLKIPKYDESFQSGT